MAALALSGCAPAEAPETAAPVPKLSPTTPGSVFLSNDEAVAAASAAYERFLAVEQEVGAAGGAGRERFAAVAADPFLSELEASYSAMEAAGNRVESAYAVSDQRLQQRWTEGGIEQIIIYACVDWSASRLFDAAGTDISKPDQLKRLTMQIEATASSATDVKIAGSELWSNDEC